MRRSTAFFTLALVVLSSLRPQEAFSYAADSTVPLAGGCPQPDRWNLSLTSPISRRWSTSLSPTANSILTTAAPGSLAQLNEIEKVISDSFGLWARVTGTMFNSISHPGLFAPITRTSAAASCSNDQENNIDGLNTICLNQSSAAFTTGVLAFTRVITANAPGATVGASGPAAFVGQILDADILFRNDGQVVFATPGALAASRGAGAYDLESLLIHELGHFFGLDHSAVWRAVMFPYAPPPGQFLGDRPTAPAPDAPLIDDDRTGVRSLYPDPADISHSGSISGRILPANSFALAVTPSPSPGSFVTGIFGAHVVAIDATTGAVVAGALGGWSCNAATQQMQFDGSYQIQRLPLNRSYVIYAEPLEGLVTPANFNDPLSDMCQSNSPAPCTPPSASTNFNPRIRPSSP
ncbi:MAG TPA: matrixin family metalloprotease [Candidatus Acidoferrum sp.]|nr:matrixin family metalloprotease [Candidatus Acidoferrum sp.]